MRVLIIEDDRTVANYINKGLSELGHIADVAHDGKEGLFLATTEKYDVLVLDRMVPHVDGMTILNALRASKIDTPTIILSAKGKVEDKVLGLKAGADDYMTKPFAFEELMARLEVLSNRQTKSTEKETVLRVNDLEVDLLARTVIRNGEEIQLQSREFTLLEYLLKHKGQVVTRTMLLENVWDYHFDPQTNIIDVHISRLRNKIDKGHDTPLIQTKRGAGYIIAQGD
ncbi:DNA-binding response regulator [Tenacibaculum sp. KUL113]|uniref:response regulator transcription factor n=1 Tax=Alteromonas sp. KUL150 TaxID=2480805 RepID=UPI0012E47FBF|nr:response regulator transcription factor [Alteromonas sp. KUL150]GFD72386.1 DNA-binding response regulator [Tenacibaculum sp. KUL113]GFD85813.1 DNA-binding response regulator [Alteromonas sp. KUL150]